MTPIRVLVADDSPTMRRALDLMLPPHEGFQLVGEAGDGYEAIRLAQSLKPDVVTMDVSMPGLDGLKATRCLCGMGGPKVVVVSAAATGGNRGLAFEALRAGAQDIVGKPPTVGRGELIAWGSDLRRVIRQTALGARRDAQTAPMAEPPLPLEPWRGRCRFVGLAASTGGPPVLATVLGALPAGFGGSVLVAQHLALGFIHSFRQWLAEDAGVRVELAQDGCPPRPGTVYLAPEGRHLELDPGGLLRTPKAGPHDTWTPSGDRLLASLAAQGPAAAGAVLTGMGRDGAQGLLRLKLAGGLALAQEPATCAVNGMPLACLTLDAACRAQAPDALASTLSLAMPGPAAGPNPPSMDRHEPVTPLA